MNDRSGIPEIWATLNASPSTSFGLFAILGIPCAAVDLFLRRRVECL